MSFVFDSSSNGYKTIGYEAIRSIIMYFRNSTTVIIYSHVHYIDIDIVPHCVLVERVRRWCRTDKLNLTNSS